MQWGGCFCCHRLTSKLVLLLNYQHHCAQYRIRQSPKPEIFSYSGFAYFVCWTKREKERQKFCSSLFLAQLIPPRIVWLCACVIHRQLMIITFPALDSYSSIPLSLSLSLSHSFSNQKDSITIKWPNKSHIINSISIGRNGRCSAVIAFAPTVYSLSLYATLG